MCFNIVSIWRTIILSKKYIFQKVFRYTCNGIYTVKSGYWLAVHLTESVDTPKPPLATSPDIAASIWRSNITPKLKHFLWRTASRAIGVASNLRRRNIHINPYCSRCCVEKETSDHVFFSCNFAKSVWRMAGIPHHFLTYESIPLEDKLRYLFTLHNNGQLEDLTRCVPFWILWRLWKSRNELVFTNRPTNIQDVLKLALADTKEWLSTFDVPQCNNVVKQRGHRPRIKWRKPIRGWVKCNYDASHYEGNTTSGLGWILRNSDGLFLHCGMGKYEGRATIEEAECTALLWAMQ